MKRREAEIVIKKQGGPQWEMKEFELRDDLTEALADVIQKYGRLDEVVEEVRKRRNE
jgi:hypothetical protein